MNSTRRLFNLSLYIFSALLLIFSFQNCADNQGSTLGNNNSVSDLAIGIFANDVNVLAGRTATLNIELTQSLSFDLRYQFATSDDSAIAGTHFVDSTGQGVIPAGQRLAQINIDTMPEQSESFNGLRFRVNIFFDHPNAPDMLAFVQFGQEGGSNAVILPPGGGNGQIKMGIWASSNTGFISTGNRITCGIKAGALYCWGQNNEGQLGTGNNTNSTTPAAVAGMEANVQAVSTNHRHTCAIQNGALFCWGRNDEFQLGSGINGDSNFPRAVQFMDSGIQAVSVGAFHTCAIKTGSLYCWGRNDDGQVGHDNGNQTVPIRVIGFESGVTAVAAGTDNTCAVQNGALYCWGQNNQGQLGLGNFTTNSSRNPQEEILAPMTGMDTDVATISSTDMAACGLKSTGALYCWGQNDFGNLGNGTTTDSSVANLVAGFDSGVTHMASGYDHTCAVRNNEVFCWGNNNHGELGLDDTTNRLAPAATPITFDLAANEWVSYISTHGASATGNETHTCAMTNLGRVFCFGFNNSGQLGDGTNVRKGIPTEVPFFSM